MATILFVAVSSSALADQHCNVPLAEWQPREALQQKVEVEGWKVTRIKTDDGCYKVSAVNEKGDRYKAKIDPGSLKVLKFSIEYKEPK
ncbi:MAG: PepSY domain-containing protein [Hyphomicrobiaceae bacterium]